MLGFAPLAASPLADDGGEGSVAIISGSAAVSGVGAARFSAVAAISGVAALSADGFAGSVTSASIAGQATVSATPFSEIFVTAENVMPAAQQGYSYAERTQLFKYVDGLGLDDPTGDISAIFRTPADALEGDLIYLFMVWDEEPGSGFLTKSGWTKRYEKVSSTPYISVFTRQLGSNSQEILNFEAVGNRIGGGTFYFVVRRGEEEQFTTGESGTTTSVTFSDANLPAKDNIVFGVAALGNVESNISGVSIASPFVEGDGASTQGTLGGVTGTASGWFVRGQPAGTGAYTMPSVTPNYPSGSVGVDWESLTITISESALVSTGGTALTSPIPTQSLTAELTRKAFGANVSPLPTQTGAGLVLRSGREVDEASAGPNAARVLGSANSTISNTGANSVITVPVDSTRIT